MISLENILTTVLRLNQSSQEALTLLAVCPNSAAVLEAAVKAAFQNNTPLLFAATLNQVDREGGYTGWTPQTFVDEIARQAEKSQAARRAVQGNVIPPPLFPCLDHGGPWLKDSHTQAKLSYAQTLAEVKLSLDAALAAGYQLLHIDPTVDRTLGDQPLAVEVVAARTLELIEHAETARARLGLPTVVYEVGTEEVHGGLVDLVAFERFLALLRQGLAGAGLESAWPRFIVAQVGTDLHTTSFDPAAARALTARAASYGSLVKGHYTDWVANPADYPATRMGGANVGPEFTAAEYRALQDLAQKESLLCARRAGLSPSHFTAVLQQAVLDSGRWVKWLQPEERGLDFDQLSPSRRDWLTQTGARYVWTQPAVLAARQRLVTNLRQVMPDPERVVVDRIVQAIEVYIQAFNLFDAATLFSG